MSAAINDGGPAFPVAEDHKVAADLPWTCGMSLRDYFAAKAMHQFLHGSVLPVGYDATEEMTLLSRRAYEMADAMLRAREQS